MIKFWPSILLAAVLGDFGAAAQPSANQTIILRNGDTLFGQLLTIDGSKNVRWQHPDASAPVEFKAPAIAEIDFPARTNTSVPAANACRVLLANGDALDGDFILCNEKTISVQTWFAGRLDLPRKLTRSIVFVPRTPAVFDGITGVDGWTQATASAAMPGEAGQWMYRNGAFYANKSASIARDLKLPDVAEVQFDLAWSGTLNLAVAIYTDSLRPILIAAKDQASGFGGFYSLRFQNTLSFLVDCLGIKRGVGLRDLGQSYLPNYNDHRRIHVDVRCSKPQHKMALYLDDTLVKMWDDPEGFIGEGTGMRFVQNPGGAIKLSNLRITYWDGIFFDSSSEPIDLTHDAFSAEGSPRAIAQVESITTEKMDARTTNGPVAVPLSKLKMVDFAHNPADEPESPIGAVRATFAQGGQLTFILDNWTPTEIVAHSVELGSVKLNPSAFTRLQFLSADKKPAENPKS